MELKVSSVEEGRLSPSDCVSDPEQKEISDDDDDDRNHKHRRRETQSQYLERGALEQVLTRPYRKWNKPFENGQPYRENNSQSSGTLRNYNVAPLEKDLSAKFENRRPALAAFPRAHMDLNQRIRANQSSSGEPGRGRGRGRVRETGYWSQRDSRFSSVDIASQMVQQGLVPPTLFAGRGLPNVSNAQSGSWSAFGLIPGIPNGGLDTLHSLGLQGSLRPPINPLNMGIPRQRCRDFEERGFCLKGDMCSLEHGVNRIVVDDVQSLSQFNLPVSLSSAQLLGIPAGTGPSSTLIDSKSSKSGMSDDGFGWNGALTGSAGAGGADFYDPDQPWWTNDCAERSTALSALNPSKIDETESLLDADLSDRYQPRFCDGSDNKCLVQSDPTAVESQSTSKPVWGRIDISKNRSEMKKKIDSASSNYVDNEANEDQVLPTSIQGAAQQGKRIIGEDIRPQVMVSLKAQGDSGHNIRKPSQKALRTLFVNGIPQKDNKKDALLSHFRKFGEVVDIYIPSSSERAFVQFLKREEAEAALKAPDAVMGNRFIKLWWANRDSIPDNGTRLGNNVSLMPHGMTVASVPPHPSITDGGKDNLQWSAPKVSFVHSSVSPLPTSGHPEAAITNGPKAPPPFQKKLEGLELMKELLKKQEMLDQKRNEFRRQLDKLERQASGLKNEVAFEQAAKRHKVGIVADVAKASIQSSTDLGTVVASPVAEVMVDKNKSAENVVHHSPKMNSVLAPQQPSVSKPSIRPLAPLGAPFIYRFKLDNRPTAFKIIPPLPSGLANVAVLKEHFSTFGELSTVELDNLDSNGSDASKNCSALISFTTRRSAERAFVDAKCWQGHNLQFTWLASSNSSNVSVKENPSSASKGSSDGNVQPTCEVASTVTQELTLSGNAESESLDRRDGEDHMERDEDLQSCLSDMSLEKQPPKGDVC